MIKSGDRKLGMDNIWLAPFETKVLGGLRGKINQFSDGSGTTITPRSFPKIKRAGVSSGLSSGEDASEGSALPVCVPASVTAYTIAPPLDGSNYPLALGAEFTFTPSGLAGTAPIGYEWSVSTSGGSIPNPAYTVRSTSSTFDYTVADADIFNKNISGEGLIAIKLVVRNACNLAGDEYAAQFDANGTP